MAGEADSDDDWGDWTATGLRGASAGAAAPAEASEAAATTTSTTATTTTTTTTTAATAATAEQEEHERRFRHFTELRAAALGLVTAGSALNDFIREAVEARRRERARHAAKQRKRDLERARELLATEKRLATAKERHAAAEDAVAGAERAVRAVANPSNARWEWLEHQLHLHSTRQAEAKASNELWEARRAAALSTSLGWAATGVARRLAAVRALAGAPLPRELRSCSRATTRVLSWRAPETDDARGQRLRRAAREKLRAERAARRRDRTRFLAADKTAHQLRRFWRAEANREAKRNAKRVAREAHASWVAERLAERQRLDAQHLHTLERAALREAETQQALTGKGLGAGRRVSGPARAALKAFTATLRAEAEAREAKKVPAKAKPKAVPKQAPLHGEVRDPLAGTTTFYSPRAASNDLGLVQHWHGEDERAEAQERLQTLEGSDSASEHGWSGVAEPTLAADDNYEDDGGGEAAAAPTTDDSFEAAEAEGKAGETSDEAEAETDDDAAGTDTGGEDEAALARARETAAELLERHEDAHCEKGALPKRRRL